MHVSNHDSYVQLANSETHQQFAVDGALFFLALIDAALPLPYALHLTSLVICCIS